MKHPVDELAEIREKKRHLLDRERELRDIILNDESTRTGSDYVARVSQQVSTRTDWQELARSLGATQQDIENFSTEAITQVVRLERARTRPRSPQDIQYEDILRKFSSERLVILDTETTGLFAKRGDRIIQIALLPVTIDEHGNCLEGNAFSTYISPKGKKSHPEAASIHGIDESQLKLAPAFEGICDTVLELIEGCTLIIHNADFDLGFLFCELDRARKFPITNNHICTLTLAKSLWPRTPCKLEDLARRFDIVVKQEDLHDALGDARVLSALLPHFIATMRNSQARIYCKVTK